MRAAPVALLALLAASSAYAFTFPAGESVGSIDFPTSVRRCPFYSLACLKVARPLGWPRPFCLGAALGRDSPTSDTVCCPPP